MDELSMLLQVWSASMEATGRPHPIAYKFTDRSRRTAHFTIGPAEWAFRIVCPLSFHPDTGGVLRVETDVEVLEDWAELLCLWAATEEFAPSWSDVLQRAEEWFKRDFGGFLADSEVGGGDDAGSGASAGAAADGSGRGGGRSRGGSSSATARSGRAAGRAIAAGGGRAPSTRASSSTTTTTSTTATVTAGDGLRRRRSAREAASAGRSAATAASERSSATGVRGIGARARGASAAGGTRGRGARGAAGTTASGLWFDRHGRLGRSTSSTSSGDGTGGGATSGGVGPLSPGTMPASPPAFRRRRTSDAFRSVWKGVPVSGSHECRERVEREIRTLFKRDTRDEGFHADVVNKNPFDWAVQLFFSKDAADPAEAALAHDLEAHAARHPERYPADKPLHCFLQLKIPAEYPAKPPQCFLRRPILADYTGSILGGAVVAAELNADHWKRSGNIADVIRIVRKTLIKGGARINMETAADYPLVAYKAARARLDFRPKAGQLNALYEFKDDMRACPASWAGQFGVRIPPSFQSSDKTLMPDRMLTSLRSSAGSDGDWVSEAPMLFEITAGNGLRAYCGVEDFTSPRVDVVVLPDWVQKSLFVADMENVQVRSVALPKLNFVRVQPHGDGFKDIVERTGLPPQAFLESAVSNYRALTRGETMPMTAVGPKGEATVFVDVVEMRPDAPACAVYAGFESTISMDFAKSRDDLGHSSLLRSLSDAPGAADAGTVAGAGSGDGRIVGDSVAAADERIAALREAANAEFAENWRRQQRAEDQKAAKWRRGLELPGTDSAKETTQMRITMYGCKSALLLKCNADARVADLFTFLDSINPMDGLDYLLETPTKDEIERPLPADGTASAQTVAGARLGRTRLLQRIRPGSTCAHCDASAACASTWVCPTCTFAGNLMEANTCVACTNPRPEVVETRAAASAERAPSELRSYVVRADDGSGRKVIGLCEDHRITWLEEMQQYGQVDVEDEHLLTESLLLRAPKATLI